MRKTAPFRLFAGTVLSLGTVTALHAQLSTTAIISGTVTDASGAVLPNAQIVVTDEQTHAQTRQQTSTDGSFTVPGLPIGTYDVTVSMNGFQSFSETGVVLHPTVTSTVIAKLRAGKVSTAVTVQASAAQVETKSSELSSDVSAAQVKTLPLNGRNYQALAAVMPGVQNLSAGSALGTGGRATNNVISVNGGLQSTTFYALDGIWDENTGNMNQTSIVPNPDSLEEVRVLQNNYSVRYSLMGATVVLLQTRSGSSQFHGNAWEYLRNDALNSRNYFSTTVPPYKQNIFGYNIAGPLYIPHLYNTNRQKTFFFFNQQFVRLNQGISLTGITPTANQRAGVFTTTIKDPLTGQPFTGDTIPTGRLNASSLAFINAVYPLPNYSAASGNNYLNNTPQVTDQRDDEIKIDHNINPAYRLTGEYLDEHQTYRQSSLNGAQAGEIFPTNYENDETKNKLAQVALTALPTPNLVNTTSVALNIFDLDLNLEGVTTLSQVPGLAETLPFNGYLAGRLPLITISGGTAPEGIPAARPLTHAADLDDTVGDDISWLHGRSYLQAGINVVFDTKRQNTTGATNGQWAFTGNFTGNGLADFLLGDASTFTQVSDQRRVGVHGMEVSPYVEDRFQLTRNVTLTAGVRVYHLPLPYPAPGSETIFDPAAFNPAAEPMVSSTGLVTATPNSSFTNGLVTNSVGSVPNNFSAQHNWYVGPSVGFAWDVFGDGKTAVRGGYGLTYTRIFTNQDCSYSCANNPPFLSSSNLVNPMFPNAAGTGIAAARTIQSLSNADLGIQASQIHSYSLAVQREFARNWTASVTGASSQIRHMVGTWNYNQPLPDGRYDFNPVINAGKVTPYLYSPYPGYGAISTLTTRQGENWNALEASLKHPLSTNLFLTVAYTWSHNLTNYTTAGGFNVIDPYHPSRYYGNAEGVNFPHSLSVTAIYSLPKLQKSRELVRQVAGGWQYSDITTLRSGTSLSPTLSTANQGNGLRPDRTTQRIPGPKTVGEWFNTAAFVAPQAGFYGDTNTGIIRGPALFDFDMAVYKDFPVWREQHFQFRGEAFNVFNHTNFTTVNTAYGNSNFGKVTAAADPRILEVALRYEF